VSKLFCSATLLALQIHQELSSHNPYRKVTNRLMPLLMYSSARLLRDRLFSSRLLQQPDGNAGRPQAL